MKLDELSPLLADAQHMLVDLARALFSTEAPPGQIVVPTSAPRAVPSRVEAAAGALVLLDSDGRIVSVDDGAAALFGIPAAELVGRPGAALFVGEDPDRPALEVVQEGAVRSLRFTPGFLGRRAGATTAPVAVEIRTLSVENRPLFALTVRDLSVRDQDAHAPLHRAQARYKALVEQIPAVTFMADLQEGSNEMYISPQIERILGYSAREWLDDPVLWYHRLHLDDRQILDREFARGIATGGPFKAECRVIAKDGHIAWIHGEAWVVRDDAGRPLFLQGIAYDISERKLAEEQIRASEAARVRHERLVAIGQLAASVSHDLRNPLGAIGYALFYVNRAIAAAKLAEQDSRLGECLAMIDRELKVCERIIGDLMNFARSRPPNLVVCPLRELVDEACSVVSHPAAVEVRNDVPADLPAPLLDHDQFRQVLVNLIQNGVEAIPQSRDGVVRINAQASADEIVMSIADNGDGIPAEVADRIFEPLLSTKPRGTGLGLAIVSNLVKAHGGTVDVESAAGLGTVFHVRIPRGPRV